MLWLFRKHPDIGELRAIFIAPDAGKPMIAVQQVQALAERGLEGDRYGQQRGFWKATDACQVTLISEQELGRARTRDPVIRDTLARGGHRRNLLVRGLNVARLHGRRFRIGEAEFLCLRPRPPCGYLDQIEGRGLCKALGRNSGVCLQVLRSGALRVGDPVELLDERR